ncbi:MAG: hypothetical protein ACJA13_003232 [Paraglaciecola sp.]|jgi:hypothetical protein
MIVTQKLNRALLDHRSSRQLTQTLCTTTFLFMLAAPSGVYAQENDQAILAAAARAKRTNFLPASTGPMLTRLTVKQMLLITISKQD